LESYLADGAIIASNTSSLSIASIAASLNKPERCVGIHFFNPAPLMRLVEVIPAVQTDETVLQKAVETIENSGTTVAVTNDTSRIIVKSVPSPFYDVAMSINEEGTADFASIDCAITQLAGFPMGTFQ